MNSKIAQACLFSVIKTNIKLNALDVRDKLTIIVLPILNKNNFMNLFKEKSEEVSGIVDGTDR